MKKFYWRELVNDWQLSPVEINYINRQQGFLLLQHAVII